jgi:hypothetical protein
MDTLAWWRDQPAERRDNPRRWPSPELEQSAIERIRPEG